MRSSVCQLNALTGDNLSMNFPDYEQLSSDHGRFLVLIRGIGVSFCIFLLFKKYIFLSIDCSHFQPNKPRSLQKIFERIQKIDNVKIKGELSSITAG